MKHMVHLGNGATIFEEIPDFVDHTDVRPRVAQCLSGVDRRFNQERVAKIAAGVAARRRPKFGPVTFAALGDLHCRWPLADKRYCGDRQEAESSYCPAHEAQSKDKSRR